MEKPKTNWKKIKFMREVVKKQEKQKEIKKLIWLQIKLKKKKLNL